ncbi:MAG: cobalamin biosynthesis protein CobD [Rhodoblastus sp.]|nr:cobalamin biosynthesis protein CobD [Rhodoblastus sp.]
MDLTENIALALLALLVEALIGYPGWLYRIIGHPVSWIGRLIGFFERKLNLPVRAAEIRRERGWGLMAGLCLLVGFGALSIHLALAGAILGFALLALLSSTLIAQRSLYAHVRDVADGLDRSLEDGRAAVSLIVGRNVADFDEAGVSRAAVESLAENFSDGVVAPTFWLALAGLPGAALYKAINTADSMIGHKTERYRDFGYAAAKIDDIANWPAARIAGALIVAAAALGRETFPLRGWRVMKRDADRHVSPNAGWPEAAMAGALHVRLGGPRAYGGNVVAGAWLGDADEPVDRTTIWRALKLYRRACVLQFFGLAFVAALLV